MKLEKPLKLDFDIDEEGINAESQVSDMNDLKHSALLKKIEVLEYELAAKSSLLKSKNTEIEELKVRSRATVEENHELFARQEIMEAELEKIEVQIELIVGGG